MCDGEADCKDRSDEMNCTGIGAIIGQHPHLVTCHHSFVGFLKLCMIKDNFGIFSCFKYEETVHVFTSVYVVTD